MGCQTIQHTVYSGADNTFTLELSTMAPDGTITLANLSVVDNTTLTLEGQIGLTVPKNQVGAPINWWDVDLTEGQMQFQLGPWVQTNMIPAGTYKALLVTYDANNSNGIVWTEYDNPALWITIHS